MPKLTIDGREVEVAQGSTILQAALSRGLEIPHYCYHPGLSIAGNCRMCLVEVEKAPKLLIACDTRVTDGMVVNTDNERVREARAAVQEFLLINHPLDCPICDQAGECTLQNYAVEHGTGISRYVETKNTADKAVDVGTNVMLDQERCIHCSRCIRFCDEVPKTGELGIFQRGNHTVIGTHPDKPLVNAYSGNVVDICPVGALTLKQFRFKTRVWYLENTPSVCVGCARGCNVVVGVGQQRELMTIQGGQLDERIKRIVPRVNEDVNGHWMCDEGRLSYERLYAGERLTEAQVPAGTPAPWDEAIRQAADAIKPAASRGKAAVILSPRLTSETLFGWRLLLDAMGGARFGVRRLVRGEDDDLLIRADKGANAKGAEWILGADTDERAVVEAAGRGELTVLVVLGDTLDAADDPEIDDALRKRLEHVIYVGPFASGAARKATLLVPTAAWSEEDGTVVNFEGRIQRVQRCHLPHGEGRPGWRVVSDIGDAAGLTLPQWTETGQVLSALGGAVQPYGGLDLDDIGLLGVPAGASMGV
jgi:NADH-quinone oxidoreductase subunit G